MVYLSLVILNGRKWIVQVTFIHDYLGASKNNNIEEQRKIGKSLICILFFYALLIFTICPRQKSAP